MASVITFSVQMGSGGENIARAVAEALNYPYYDREIVNRAAAAVGVNPETVAQAEHWPSLLERLVESLSMTSTVADAMLPPVPPSRYMTMTSSDYRHLIERVVEELAQRGHSVIVGHAGQVILKEHPGVFRSLIWGSEEVRADRLSKSSGQSAEDALKALRESDQTRHEFFKHVYDIDWLDSRHYDVTLKTDAIDLDDATDAVLTLLRQAPRRS
jgi:cytidylate kinase